MFTSEKTQILDSNASYIPSKDGGKHCVSYLQGYPAVILGGKPVTHFRTSTRRPAIGGCVESTWFYIPIELGSSAILIENRIESMKYMGRTFPKFSENNIIDDEVKAEYDNFIAYYK